MNASEQRRRRIAALYLNGATANDLAAQEGVSPGRIRQMLHEAGALKRSPRDIDNEAAARRQRIAQAYEEGRSAEAIAAEEGVSECRIYQILRSAGVVVRQKRRPPPSALEGAHPVMRLLLDALRRSGTELRSACAAAGLSYGDVARHLRRGTVPSPEVFNSLLEGGRLMLRAETEQG